MTELTFFLSGMIAEPEMLEFLETVLNCPLDSLNVRKPDSPLFFQYETYQGEYKVMVSISSPKIDDRLLDRNSVCKVVSQHFDMDIISELEKPKHGKSFERFSANGYSDYVNIRELKDGFEIVE